MLLDTADCFFGIAHLKPVVRDEPIVIRITRIPSSGDADRICGAEDQRGVNFGEDKLQHKGDITQTQKLFGIDAQPAGHSISCAINSRKNFRIGIATFGEVLRSHRPADATVQFELDGPRKVEVRDRFTVSTLGLHRLKETKPQARNSNACRRIVCDDGPKPVLLQIWYLAVVRNIVVRRPVAIGVHLGMRVDQRPHRLSNRLCAGEKFVDHNIEAMHMTPNVKLTCRGGWSAVKLRKRYLPPRSGAVWLGTDLVAGLSGRQLPESPPPTCRPLRNAASQTLCNL